MGGEGILRTHGRVAEAVQVIHRALDQGVNYCDTAPAYTSSLDYYGTALGDRAAMSSWPPRSTTAPVTDRCGSWTKACGGCGLIASTSGSCTIYGPCRT